MMMAAVPLANYRERLPQVRRDFELYPDHVLVRARWTLSGKEYTQRIELDTLKCDTTTFFIRQRWFKRALGIAALAVASAVVFSQPAYQHWNPWVVRGLYVLAIAAGVVMAATARKVKFIRFVTSAGRPGLELAAIGPDAGRFDEFVAAVRKRVGK